MAEKYRYGEMTWPEVKEAAARPCVAIVPIATLEDHGLHLPIDTDLLLCASVCELAASRAADRAVLVPPINHGYSPHHMDFPGAITIGPHTLIDYGLDVCKSLAHHGFQRILIVNGHGSNAPFIDIIARLCVVQTGALAAAVSYWAAPGVREVAESLRESEPVGGMNHACEFETSLYLALRPDLVDMQEGGARALASPVEELLDRSRRRRRPARDDGALEPAQRQRRHGRSDQGDGGEGTRPARSRRQRNRRARRRAPRARTAAAHRPSLRRLTALLLLVAALSGCTRAHSNAAAGATPGRFRACCESRSAKIPTISILLLGTEDGRSSTYLPSGARTRSAGATVTSSSPSSQPSSRRTTNGGISRDGLTYHVPFAPQRHVARRRAVHRRRRDLHLAADAQSAQHDRQPRRIRRDCAASNASTRYTIVVHLKRRFAPFVNTFFAPGQSSRRDSAQASARAAMPTSITSPITVCRSEPVPFASSPTIATRASRWSPTTQYWRGPPQLRRIDFRIVGSDETMLAQLSSHDIDFFYRAPESLAPELRGIPGHAPRDDPDRPLHRRRTQRVGPGLERRARAPRARLCDRSAGH